MTVRKIFLASDTKTWNAWKHHYFKRARALLCHVISLTLEDALVVVVKLRGIA